MTRFSVLTAIFAVGVTSIFISGVTACSGAGDRDQELFAALAPQKDVSKPVSPLSPASPGAGTPETPVSAATPPPLAIPDAGIPLPLPLPPLQPAVCTQEAEPNNSLLTATSFRTGLCGTIDGAADTDFGSFTVPPNAKSIAWRHREVGGRLSYAFSILGTPVQEVDDGFLDTIPGTTYTVQIRPTSGAAVFHPTYELTITIE